MCATYSILHAAGHAQQNFGGSDSIFFGYPIATEQDLAQEENEWDPPVPVGPDPALLFYPGLSVSRLSPYLMQMEYCIINTPNLVSLS